MSDPWFRPYARISYQPATWQGWAVIAAMAAVAGPLGIVSVFIAESRPVLSWTLGVLAVLAVLVGHGVVVWKMDRDYRRR
jgi:hypothetical protein